MTSIVRINSINIQKIVDLNPSNSVERLIIGENRFIHVMPEQLNIIIDKMLCEVAGTKEPPHSLDLATFKKFLDLNPGLRQVVRECLRPDLWTLEGGPVSEGGGGPLGTCISPVPRGGGTIKSISQSKKEDRAGAKPKPMEGELYKVGRRTDQLVKRWFTLDESGLVQFKTKNDLLPKGKIRPFPF
jgi:hypothetical protein